MTIIRVIDFETTGFKPPEAEVCEVGWTTLDLESRAIEASVSFFCSVRAMPPEARAVHHISTSDCKDMAPFDREGILTDGIAAYAAHNAEFELQFFTPNVPMICTYKAALRVWPDAPGHSNGCLRYWLEDNGKIAALDDADTQPAHRAGPDSYVTAHILTALFNEGITGRDMVAWTKEPALLPRCPLGKFRGKSWPEVDAGFLGWMLRQADMDEGLKWNAQREIARRSGGK